MKSTFVRLRGFLLLGLIGHMMPVVCVHAQHAATETAVDKPATRCSQNRGQLDPAEWTVARIGHFQVVNSAAKTNADKYKWSVSEGEAPAMCDRVQTLKAGCSTKSGLKADMMVVGAFYSDNLMGTVMRKGRVDNLIDAESVAFFRPGMAMLSDGSMMFCNPGLAVARDPHFRQYFTASCKGFDSKRMGVAGPKCVANAYGRGPKVKLGGLPVDKRFSLNDWTLNHYCVPPTKQARGVRIVSYVGGLVDLINSDRPVCATAASKQQTFGSCDTANDMIAVQGFSARTESFAGARQDFLQAGMFRSHVHTIFAQRGDSFYVLFNNASVAGASRGRALGCTQHCKSGYDIQKELCEAGFSNVKKGDGGGGFSVAYQNFKGQKVQYDFGNDNPTAVLIHLSK